MNNVIRNHNGVTMGYRCYTCRGVFDAMWGEACNECREAERRHQELLSAQRKDEDVNYWRHVAYELAGGDRAKVDAAGTIVCDKFIAAGREHVGPKLPKAHQA
jgi:hypothetical protein